MQMGGCSTSIGDADRRVTHSWLERQNNQIAGLKAYYMQGFKPDGVVCVLQLGQGFTTNRPEYTFVHQIVGRGY